MRRFLTVTLTLFIFLIIAAFVLIKFVLLAHDDLTPYDDLFVDQSEQVQPGQVHVTFAGVSTLLISDGTTNLMVDGFFSRPGITQVMFGEVGPDEDAIDWGLARLGVSTLDAIFPVHAHYDHAMDTPIVAAKTGAVMLGGPSASMIARGVNLPEDQIVTVEEGQSYRFGAFDVRFIEGVHAPVATQNAMQPEITAPLVPPANAFAYPTGKAWSIVIGHTTPEGLRKQMLVQGSAGYVEGNLADIKADAVFLGIGGFGSQAPEQKQAYWDETIKATQVQNIYLTHWDDFFLPLTEPLKASGGPMNKFEAGMDYLQERSLEEGHNLHMMRAFATVLPFAE